MTDTASSFPNYSVKKPEENKSSVDWDQTIEEEIKRQMESQAQGIKEDSAKLAERHSLPAEPEEDATKPPILSVEQENNAPIINSQQSTSPETPTILTNQPPVEEEEEEKEKPVAVESKQQEPAAVLSPADNAVTAASEEAPTVNPLQASVLKALSDLKEDDKVGPDWTLKKIINTTFGNNRSSFYELTNKAGVNWTLNLEEMKDLLKNNLLGKETKATQDETPSQKSETLVTEEPQTEAKSSLFNKLINKPKASIPESTPQENAEQTNSLGLSREQVALLQKIHQNSQDWKTFTSFSSEQWAKLGELYEQGNLSEIGIDAHPLIDFLTDSDNSTLVTTEKGEDFQSILTKNGHTLTWTSEDAPLLAIHAIANRKLLEETFKKAESSGISVGKFPTNKEIKDLVSSALGGNQESFHALQKTLQIIPSGQKIRLISPEKVAGLEKYFSY